MTKKQLLLQRLAEQAQTIQHAAQEAWIHPRQAVRDQVLRTSLDRLLATVAVMSHDTSVVAYDLNEGAIETYRAALHEELEQCEN